jgi:hypothetical protein
VAKLEPSRTNRIHDASVLPQRTMTNQFSFTTSPTLLGHAVLANTLTAAKLELNLHEVYLQKAYTSQKSRAKYWRSTPMREIARACGKVLGANTHGAKLMCVAQLVAIDTFFDSFGLQLPLARQCRH